MCQPASFKVIRDHGLRALWFPDVSESHSRILERARLADTYNVRGEPRSMSVEVTSLKGYSDPLEEWSYLVEWPAGMGRPTWFEDKAAYRLVMSELRGWAELKFVGPREHKEINGTRYATIFGGAELRDEAKGIVRGQAKVVAYDRTTLGVPGMAERFHLTLYDDAAVMVGSFVGGHVALRSPHAVVFDVSDARGDRRLTVERFDGTVYRRRDRLSPEPAIICGSDAARSHLINSGNGTTPSGRFECLN